MEKTDGEILLKVIFKRVVICKMSFYLTIFILLHMLCRFPSETSVLSPSHSIDPLNTNSHIIIAVSSSEFVHMASTSYVSSTLPSIVTTHWSSYDKYLKFDVTAVINSLYSETLKNINSLTYKNFSNHLNTKFEVMFNTSSFFTSSLYNVSDEKGSIKFGAFLYFEVNTTLDAEQITSSLDENGHFSNVIVKELCTTNTCGLVGTCLISNASCSCKYGFKGRRCEIKYSVNGTHYGKWSLWTPCSRTCGGGLRKRFSWCTPTPVHNGKCLVTPSTRIVNESCNEQFCNRNHDDEDYYLAAYICGGVLLLILLLLIAFCCTVQTKGTEKRSSTQLNYDKSNIKTSMDRSSLQYADGDNQNQNALALHSITSVPQEPVPHEPVNNSAFDNMAYRGNDELSESEQIYRDQIQKFLQQAPDIRYNVVVPRSPRGKRDKRSPKYEAEEEVMTSSPKPRPQIRRSITKETTAKRLADVNAKFVQHGPSKYRLVMI